jgi:uncharacterized protein YjdB
MRRFILFGIACCLVLAATGCDQATSPRLANLLRGTVGQTGSLQVLPNHVQVVTGQTFQLQTNAPLSLANQVQWASSQPAIAAVNTSGVVTGLFPGTATITARFAFDTTQAASATVTVLGIAGP